MIKYFLKLPIFKRLIPSITKRVFKLSKNNRKFFKIKNINFFLDFLDPIDRQIILNKEYEHDQVSFLEDKMKKICFSYFLDIGANSGYYSFFFADKFKSLNIIAFEPNFDAFEKFRKTMHENPFQNIKIHNYGLSDHERDVELRSMIKDGFIQSNSAVIDNRHKYAIEDFKINRAKLKVGDEVLSFKNEKILIKIDVEGHEEFTLKGLTKTLSKNECFVLVEISDSRFEEVNSFLNKMNYKIVFKSQRRMDYIYTNFRKEIN